MASKLKSSVGHAQEVALMGGPWHDKTITVRPRDRHQDDMSLPLRVGDHPAGRYNLRTGQWTPLEGEA